MVENASFKIDPPKFTVDEGVVRYSSLRKVTMAYPVVMADVTGDFQSFWTIGGEWFVTVIRGAPWLDAHEHGQGRP